MTKLLVCCISNTNTMILTHIPTMCPPRGTSQCYISYHTSTWNSSNMYMNVRVWTLQFYVKVSTHIPGLERWFSSAFLRAISKARVWMWRKGLSHSYGLAFSKTLITTCCLSGMLHKFEFILLIILKSTYFICHFSKCEWHHVESTIGFHF